MNIMQSTSDSAVTTRASAANVDMILPSSSLPSLESLLNAMPTGFPSALLEPSVCPSPFPYSVDRKGQTRSQPSTIPEDERVSPSILSPRPLNSNAPAAQNTDTENLYRKNNNFLDYYIRKHESNIFPENGSDPSLAVGGNYDTLERKGTLGQASKHSCKDVGELLPSSEHVKVHRAFRGGSSADVQGNPGYLQLDLQALGSDCSHEPQKKTESVAPSRHISLRKSLANFRKKPGQEALLGDSD
jgi:hypothetical protein